MLLDCNGPLQQNEMVFVFNQVSCILSNIINI